MLGYFKIGFRKQFILPVCNHFVAFEDIAEEEVNMEDENNKNIEQNWKDVIHTYTEFNSIVIRHGAKYILIQILLRNSNTVTNILNAKVVKCKLESISNIFHFQVILLHR